MYMFVCMCKYVFVVFVRMYAEVCMYVCIGQPCGDGWVVRGPVGLHRAAERHESGQQGHSAALRAPTPTQHGHTRGQDSVSAERRAY